MQKNKRLSVILLLPGIFFSYPALAGLFVCSEVPLYFGRYSAFLLIFNLLNLGILMLLAWAWLSKRHWGLYLSYLGLIVATLLVPGNNQLFLLPGILVLLPIIRLVAGISLIVTEFDRQQGQLNRAGKIALSLSTILITLSFVDLALLAVINSMPKDRKAEVQRQAQLREVYDLNQIEPNDIVIVGDSFVWGQGVLQHERFGDQLEGLLSTREQPSRVFSLGWIGKNLTKYIEQLDELPKDAIAGRIVASFYLNDMPAQKNLYTGLQDLPVALGRSMLSIRLIGDLIAKFFVSDVDTSHALIIDSLRTDHNSFAKRWSILEQKFSELHRLASEHTRSKPVMLILPIMVDFNNYPLRTSHVRIAELARKTGFQVIDMLPIFQAELGDGTNYRAAPNDNHFDAKSHAIVAQTLAERLFP